MIIPWRSIVYMTRVVFRIILCFIIIWITILNEQSLHILSKYVPCFPVPTKFVWVTGRFICYHTIYLCHLNGYIKPEPTTLDKTLNSTVLPKTHLCQPTQLIVTYPQFPNVKCSTRLKIVSVYSCFIKLLPPFRFLSSLDPNSSDLINYVCARRSDVRRNWWCPWTWREMPGDCKRGQRTIPFSVKVLSYSHVTLCMVVKRYRCL